MKSAASSLKKKYNSFWYRMQKQLSFCEIKTIETLGASLQADKHIPTNLLLGGVAICY